MLEKVDNNAEGVRFVRLPRIMSYKADQHPSDSEDEKQRAAPGDRQATKVRARVKAVDNRYNQPRAA
jgi:hypothetical protein